jgi:Tol biopolymer transport system component
LLLAIVPATSWAAYPGANGLIAYSGHYRSQHRHIFTVRPDGSETRQLTNDERNDVQPSWSASGRRIVYVRRGSQVFTIGANGGHETRVIRDSKMVRSPHFSPNGRRIIYQRVPGGAVITMRTDGTDRRRVVTGAWPSYSPSGERILFAGTPSGKSVGGVWTIHPDGSHLRRVTRNGKSHYDEMPEWAPDGRHILFVRCDIYSQHECEGALDLIRADGSHKRQIGGWVGTEYSPPTFSPSGKLIARVRLESQSYDAVFCADIYPTTLTGSDKPPVTHNCEDFDNGGPGGFAEQPSWQPLPGD